MGKKGGKEGDTPLFAVSPKPKNVGKKGGKKGGGGKAAAAGSSGGNDPRYWKTKAGKAELGARKKDAALGVKKGEELYEEFLLLQQQAQGTPGAAYGRTSRSILAGAPRT